MAYVTSRPNARFRDTATHQQVRPLFVTGIIAYAVFAIAFGFTAAFVLGVFA